MSTAPLDWEVIVAQGHVSGQWFGAALRHGSHFVRNKFEGVRLHTPWMPTELAARTAIEALVAMEG